MHVFGRIMDQRTCMQLVQYNVNCYQKAYILIKQLNLLPTLVPEVVWFTDKGRHQAYVHHFIY